MYAKRSRGVNEVLESAILSNMKASYEKLHHKNAVCVRDIFGWRLSSFQNVCRKYYARKIYKDLGYFDNDHLYRNGAARRAFKKSLKHRSSSSAETSLLALILFDAIMTDATDSVSFIAQNSF